MANGERWWQEGRLPSSPASAAAPTTQQRITTYRMPASKASRWIARSWSKIAGAGALFFAQLRRDFRFRKLRSFLRLPSTVGSAPALLCSGCLERTLLLMILME